MKKVAIVGFGFMGRMHYGCWKRLCGAKVAALCDSNLAQLKRASGGKVVAADFSRLSNAPDSVALVDAERKSARTGKRVIIR